jgi:hypothetical protein
MSMADPQRQPDRDREMSDTNMRTLGRAVGTDPRASGAPAGALTMAGFTARGKAFRFPKGQSGNPDGQSRFYHACRKLAREASPEMMAGLIDLAKNAVDERVRSVCLVAVLDRAGVRPIDYDPTVDKASERPKFDPSLYSWEELDLIERCPAAGGRPRGRAEGRRGDWRGSAAQLGNGAACFERTRSQASKNPAGEVSRAPHKVWDHMWVRRTLLSPTALILRIKSDELGGLRYPHQRGRDCQHTGPRRDTARGCR